MIYFTKQCLKKKTRSSKNSKDLAIEQTFGHTNSVFSLTSFLFCLEFWYQRKFQWPNNQKLLVRYLQLHIFIIPWWKDCLLTYFSVFLLSLLKRKPVSASRQISAGIQYLYFHGLDHSFRPELLYFVVASKKNGSSAWISILIELCLIIFLWSVLKWCPIWNSYNPNIIKKRKAKL